MGGVMRLQVKRTWVWHASLWLYDKTTSWGQEAGLTRSSACVIMEMQDVKVRMELCIWTLGHQLRSLCRLLSHYNESRGKTSTRFTHSIIYKFVHAAMGVMTAPYRTGRRCEGLRKHYLCQPLTKMQHMQWLKCLMSHSFALSPTYVLPLRDPNHGECWLACSGHADTNLTKRNCSNINNTHVGTDC